MGLTLPMEGRLLAQDVRVPKVGGAVAAEDPRTHGAQGGRLGVGLHVGTADLEAAPL